LDCIRKTHETGKHADHESSPIDLFVADTGELLCVHCDVRRISRSCVKCSDSFCEICYVSRHSRGHKAGHQWSDVVEPPLNPYVSKNVNSLSPKSKKHNISLHVKSYVRDVAKRHKWATYNILVQRESDRKDHEELVTKFKLELRDMFERYDKDGSGSIDRWELMDMIRSELCEPVSENEIDEAMKVIDINGDGTVDYSEFVEWWVVDNVETKTHSLKLDILRTKLRGDKALRESLESLRRGIAWWQFRKGRTGVRVVDKLKNINIAGKIAKNLGKGEFDVRTDSGEMIRNVNFKKLQLRKYVRGTYGYQIQVQDYENYERHILRYAKEKHKIDIDLDATSKEKMFRVFKKMFMPHWNGGQLDRTYYRDGYEFEFDGSWWKQTWNQEKKEFHFYNETTKLSQLEHPSKLKKMRAYLREPFNRYADVVAVDHYIVVSQRVAKIVKQKKKRDTFFDEEDQDEEDEPEKADEEENYMLYTYTIPMKGDDTVYRQRRKAQRAVRQLLREYEQRGEKPPDPPSGGLSRQAFAEFLEKELCEPYQSRQVTNAFELLDVYGDGSVEFEEFAKWYVRESEKPYRHSMTIRNRRAKLKLSKAKRKAADVISKLKLSDKKVKAIQDTYDSVKSKILQIGASSEVKELMQKGYARSDASDAVDYCPEDPLSWLERHNIKKQANKKLSLNLSKMFRPPAFMRRALIRRKKRLKKKRMKKMDARREAIRSKLSAKNERLAGLFGGDDNETEDLSGKVVYGCVLCDCDEYLANPHKNNLCAACGHEEAEHTIEYELYYEDELDNKTREEQKITELIERTMERG
jgi:calmodulin